MDAVSATPVRISTATGSGAPAGAPLRHATEQAERVGVGQPVVEHHEVGALERREPRGAVGGLAQVQPPLDAVEQHAADLGAVLGAVVDDQDRPGVSCGHGRQGPSCAGSVARRSQ